MSDYDLAVLFKELYVKDCQNDNPDYKPNEFTDILLKDLFNFLFLVYQAGANH